MLPLKYPANGCSVRLCVTSGIVLMYIFQQQALCICVVYQWIGEHKCAKGIHCSRQLKARHLYYFSSFRYYAIVQPLDYPLIMTSRRVFIMLIIVWLAPALLSFLPICSGWYTTSENWKYLKSNPDVSKAYKEKNGEIKWLSAKPQTFPPQRYLWINFTPTPFANDKLDKKQENKVKTKRNFNLVYFCLQKL